MLNCVKIPVIYIRARIREYVQEFLCFCCHKCHTFLGNPLKYSGLWCVFEGVLTFWRFHPQKNDGTTEKNTLFVPSFFPKNIVFLPLFSPECDTCDSKKSTSLLEGARCAYAREGFAFFSLLAFHLHLGYSLVILLVSGTFDR